MTLQTPLENPYSEAPRRHIRLGLYAPGCLPGYQLPYFAAAAGGEFSEQGLDVELAHPGGGLDTLRAVGRGDLDACFTSASHYLRAVQEDPSMPARFGLMIARRTHLAAFVVDRGEGLAGSPTVFEELEDARLIGDEQSTFTRECIAALAAVGLPPPQVVEASHGEDLKLLLRNEGGFVVEFLEMLPRFSSLARRRGLRIRVLPFFEVVPDVYGSGLVIADRVIDEEPSVARLMITSVRNAIFATREDPKRRVPALQGWLPGVTEGRAIEAWRLTEQLIFDEEGDVGVMSEGRWSKTISHFVSVHGGPRPDLGRVFANPQV